MPVALRIPNHLGTGGVEFQYLDLWAPLTSGERLLCEPHLSRVRIVFHVLKPAPRMPRLRENVVVPVHVDTAFFDAKRSLATVYQPPSILKNSLGDVGPTACVGCGVGLIESARGPKVFIFLLIWLQVGPKAAKRFPSSLSAGKRAGRILYPEGRWEHVGLGLGGPKRNTDLYQDHR